MIFIVSSCPGWWGDLLNWVLNRARVHMGEAYNKVIKWRDSITLPQETGNNIEK